MNLSEKVQALSITLGSNGWKEVIVPALVKAIQNNVDMLISQQQPKTDPHVSDDGLRQRIIALRWVLSWDKNFKLLAEQLEAAETVNRQTEPAKEGGSPYD